MNEEAKLSVRCRQGNADHHLWNNNGTLWCHLTVHFADFTKRRLRLSLDTADVLHARQLRDSLLALFGVRPMASLASVRVGNFEGKGVA
jgi:hypothetical protein